MGDTALVGAPVDDIVDQFDDIGSAYVFTRSGITWTEQGKLNALVDYSQQFFGHSVSSLVTRLW